MTIVFSTIFVPLGVVAVVGALRYSPPPASSLSAPGLLRVRSGSRPSLPSSALFAPRPLSTRRLGSPRSVMRRSCAGVLLAAALVCAGAAAQTVVVRPRETCSVDDVIVGTGLQVRGKRTGTRCGPRVAPPPRLSRARPPARADRPLRRVQAELAGDDPSRSGGRAERALLQPDRLQLGSPEHGPARTADRAERHGRRVQPARSGHAPVQNAGGGRQARYVGAGLSVPARVHPLAAAAD